MTRLFSRLYHALVNRFHKITDSDACAEEGGCRWLLWNAHTYSDEGF